MYIYVVDFYDTYEDSFRILGAYSTEELAKKAIKNHLEEVWDDPEDMMEHEADYNIDSYILDQ